jgi:hypothetical protein
MGLFYTIKVSAITVGILHWYKHSYFNLLTVVQVLKDLLEMFEQTDSMLNTKGRLFKAGLA